MRGCRVSLWLRMARALSGPGPRSVGSGWLQGEGVRSQRHVLLTGEGRALDGVQEGGGARASSLSSWPPPLPGVPPPHLPGVVSASALFLSFLKVFLCGLGFKQPFQSRPFLLLLLPQPPPPLTPLVGRPCWSPLWVALANMKPVVPSPSWILLGSPMVVTGGRSSPSVAGRGPWRDSVPLLACPCLLCRLGLGGGQWG